MTFESVTFFLPRKGVLRGGTGTPPHSCGAERLSLIHRHIYQCGSSVSIGSNKRRISSVSSLWESATSVSDGIFVVQDNYYIIIFLVFLDFAFYLFFFSIFFAISFIFIEISLPVRPSKYYVPLPNDFDKDILSSK